MVCQAPSSKQGNMPFSSAPNPSGPPQRSSTSQSVPSSGYGNRRPSAFSTFTKGLRKKSEVEIVLDDGEGLIHSYSTFDQIKGHVEMKFDTDTLIEDMNITFEGQSQTYVDKIATASPTTGRTTGRHVFLRMQQPIGEDSLPEHNLAKANTPYLFPFSFVVPDRLLPYVCIHKVEHESVTKAHLGLPPSMGDPMLAGDGQILMDDLAPEMAKILYSIKVRVNKASPSTGRSMEPAEKSVRVRIIPAREEEAPIDVAEDSSSYFLHKEKNVRKGLFKIGKKLGRLTAETSQPRSFRLPHPQQKSTEPVTTVATVNLRFDPAAADEQPPQMGNLSSKLRVYTFFGAAAYQIIPEVGRCDNWSNLHGVFPEAFDLSSRNIGSVNWTRHEAGSNNKSRDRRPSEFTTNSDASDLSRSPSTSSTLSTSSSHSDKSIPRASEAYNPLLPYYTAKILVPVSLPNQSISAGDTTQSPSSPISKTSRTLSRHSKKVVFLPSFHSCIVSRTYTLEFNISFHPVTSSGNTTSTVGAPSVTLRAPVQISQQAGNHELPIDIETFEAQSQVLAQAQLQLASDEYDEAVARQLDRELNHNSFRNPFGDAELIPEYEEVQTTLPFNMPSRHESLALPAPSHRTQELPPQYYTPFRNRNNTVGQGRRVSIRS